MADLTQFLPECFPSYSARSAAGNSASLEAAASGLPVVATPMGGTEEVLCSPEHGVVVPPRDPAALAAGLERLLADPALAARMGSNALRRVREKFDWERIADTAEAELEDLLTGAVAREAARVDG